MSESFDQAIARIGGMMDDADTKVSAFRGCLYGPSGPGKSTLAAMILRSIVNRDEKVILDIDTSEGYVSWRNHPGLNSGIKVIPFTNYADFRKIIQAVKMKIAPFDKVGGIIVDEYSKMQETNVLRVHEAREQGQFSASMNAGPTQSVVPEGIDYQIDLAMFRKMNAELMDLRDVHIVVIAHQDEKKDRQGNIMSVFPSFGPKVGRNVKEGIHLAAHITGKITKDAANPTVTRIERTAQVHPSLSVDAKCRLNISSTSVPAETLPVLIREWINNGGTLARAEDAPRADIHTQEELNEAAKGLDPEAIKELVEAPIDLNGLDDIFSSGIDA